MCGNAALRHDRAIKFAFAAIEGIVTLPPHTTTAADGTVTTNYMHAQPDSVYPHGFNLSYAQAALRSGGSALRPWAGHANAAFIGAWSLTVQSAWSEELGRSFFPVLDDIMAQAHAPPTVGSCLLADDLRHAWDENKLAVATLREAGAKPDTITACSGWLAMTGGDVRRLREMPDKAQRRISQTLLVLQAAQYELDAVKPELGGGPLRLANYRAECNPFADAAWSGVVPWPEKDGGPHSKRLTMINNYYDTALARRLRLTRPVAAHAPADCAAPNCRHGAHLGGLDLDGDHDEGSCTDRQGQRQAAHDMFVAALALLLKQCLFRSVRTDKSHTSLRHWDNSTRPELDTNGAPTGNRIPTPEGDRRVPDIIAVSPNGCTTYIIDVRIAWNLTTSIGSGPEYVRAGQRADEAETDKRSDWRSCLDHHRDFSTGEGAEFVAFGVETAGGLGKEARAFYLQCLEWANGHNDVDSCHWIAMSFRRHWNMRFGVLLSRERARIGLAAAKGATTKMRRQLGTTDTEPGGMS